MTIEDKIDLRDQAEQLTLELTDAWAGGLNNFDEMLKHISESHRLATKLYLAISNLPTEEETK